MVILNSHRPHRTEGRSRTSIRPDRPILVPPGHDTGSRRRALRQRLIYAVAVLAACALVFELAEILRLAH